MDSSGLVIGQTTVSEVSTTKRDGQEDAQTATSYAFSRRIWYRLDRVEELPRALSKLGERCGRCCWSIDLLTCSKLFDTCFLLRIVNAASSVRSPQKWRQKDAKSEAALPLQFEPSSESCFKWSVSSPMSFAFSSEALGPGVQLSMQHPMGAWRWWKPMVGSARCPVPLRPPHRFHSGAIYVGQWCGNQRHGLGRQTWSETLGVFGWFLFQRSPKKQLGKTDRWEGGQETCSRLVR